MNEHNPLSRLREVREAKAMSLDELAAKSGVSRSIIYAYERRNLKHRPRPDTITKLSFALGVRPMLLSTPSPEPELNPVFMRNFRSKTRTKFLLAVERQMPWVRQLVSALEDYVDVPKPDIPDFLPPSDPQKISNEQIEEAAAALRRHWGLGDGVIRDLITLVETKGCIVIPELVQCESIDAFSQWSSKGRAFIVLNSILIKGVRWRVDVAHELGHLVMHRKIDRRFLEENPNTHQLIEDQAFRFARSFLLPKTTFQLSVPHVTLDALLLAKQHWYVSVASMLYRAEELGMIDHASARRMWANRLRRGWKEKEPLDETIPTDSSRLLGNAIRSLLENDPAKLEELCLRTGLDYGDISRYTGIPEIELTQVENFTLRPSLRTSGDLTLFGSG